MKKIAGILLAFCMLLTSQSISVLADTADNAQSDKLSITFHYSRSDGSYDKWSLWIWEDGKDGSEYAFDGKDDSGALATVTYKDVNEDTKIGFLVKYGDWEKKDVEEDRYLDLTKAVKGKLDVYLHAGESRIYYENIDEQHLGFVSASWEEIDLVSVKMRYRRQDTVDQNEVVIRQEDGTVVPASVESWEAKDGQIKAMFRTQTPMQPYTAYQCTAEGVEPLYIGYGKVYDSEEFNRDLVYDGDDLGVTFIDDKVQFCVWAPTAQQVTLCLYSDGQGGAAVKTQELTQTGNGAWKLTLSKAEALDRYYTYRVRVSGEENEVIDPYAKSCGTNGERGMVLDLSETDPDGFASDKAPETESDTDDVIYEMSVRDYTIDASSGVTNAGKYLGLTETGTKNKEGDSTGLDYLKELGVAYVQIMPTQDFYGVDETDGSGYNWGYNPMNWNIPEGSYSTDAAHGEVRVNEYKKMVQSLHQAGIRVILDVVYNHTYQGLDSNLNKIVPFYYYRFNEDGTLSNGSACGNEVATERVMARKMIVDSVSYWVSEYHVDGFRFDLMGLFDLETTKEIEKTLHAINPDLLLYGEGWNAGESVYEEDTAVSENAKKLEGIGFFNNAYRRGIQSFICNDEGKKKANINWVYFGTEGAADFAPTKKMLGSWTASPRQSIQYTSCHDGYTLYDLIMADNPSDSRKTRLERNKMAFTLVMTGAGIPFFQSGEEFLRRKTNDDGTANANSYNAGDAVNAIDWDLRTKNKSMVDFYREMIDFRKERSELAVADSAQLNDKLEIDFDAKADNQVKYSFTNHYFHLWNTRVTVLCDPQTPVVCEVTTGGYPGLIAYILFGILAIGVVVWIIGMYRRKRR